MARIENWYKQDLKKPVPIRRMETVFNQDALGHLFGVEVYSDGDAVTLAGSVTGYCLLADGTTVPVSGTRSANKASIVIPQTAYSVIGPITITVKLTEGSAITTLLAVVGMVARSRTGQQVNPGSTITDWTNQISAQLQAVQTAADNLGSTLAAPFSTATAYAAGTYVMYNGNLYRFTNDHVAGDWSSSEVTQVKACNEISDLKSAFDGLWLDLNVSATFENGTFSTATGAITSATNRVVSSEIHLLQGDRFTLERNASNLMQIFGVFNASKTAFTCPVSPSWALADIDWVATYECYLIVQIRTNTNAKITPEDISPTINVYRSYKYLVEKNAADISTLDGRMDDIEAVIDGDYEFKRYTKASEIWTVEDGYYASSGGKAANANYILLEYIATRDFSIYCDAAMLTNRKTVYLAIYNNATISAANLSTIYRLTTSENTMPTENAPATVYAGQILTISIYTPESDPRDIAVWANIEKGKTVEEQIASKIENFAQGKKIAWFGDSISELKSLPHITGSLMAADVYDCSIRGSTIGRTYSNYDTFSFYNLVTAVISGDFSAQFAQLDAYEQAQGRTYPGIRENLTTLSTLDFDDVDYVVLLQGTNDFGITAVHAADGYATKVAEMKARMDDAISRFITAYPKLKFYIISPPFRATPTEDYYGNTLADYIAAEQEVAEKYAIAFYNLLINSRICDANKSTYMNSDGGIYVHPNDYGDAWLAELAAKFISVN